MATGGGQGPVRVLCDRPGCVVSELRVRFRLWCGPWGVRGHETQSPHVWPGSSPQWGVWGDSARMRQTVFYGDVYVHSTRVSGYTTS